MSKKKVPTLKPKKPIKGKGGSGMGDVIAVDKEIRYGKKVSPSEKKAVEEAKKKATKKEIKKGYKDTAHYDAADYKLGGPLKYAVGGPVKPAWMRNR